MLRGGPPKLLLAFALGILGWKTALGVARPAPERADSTRSAPRHLLLISLDTTRADRLGSYGYDRPTTPNLDRWAREGIWFERLYATGTRSARGLEAIVTGFPPTTSQSVLKLGNAQQNFFTLGGLLRQHGYDTSFIYGGEAQFDNMRRFFMNNNTHPMYRALPIRKMSKIFIL